MAKKKKEEVSLEETPLAVQAETAVKKEEPKKDSWEIKDRMYYLRDGMSPLTYTIRSRGIYWYDAEKGYEREIKYTLNQRTPFVDEFKGEARLGHIVFEQGMLFVPKEKQTLQRLLTIHPDKNKLFFERDEIREAEEDLDILEMRFQALSSARNLEIDEAEAMGLFDEENLVDTGAFDANLAELMSEEDLQSVANDLDEGFQRDKDSRSEYDEIAEYYHQFKLNLIVADYRGYGLSTGKPTKDNLHLDSIEILRVIWAVASALLEFDVFVPTLHESSFGRFFRNPLCTAHTEFCPALL